MGTPPGKEWDAAAYHRVSEPQVAWGERVLARLTLRGDERVLDAGCGSGRLTARLLEQLPHGHVLAADLSRNMLAEARAHLAPRFGNRVQFLEADLAALRLPAPVDVVFSTATFHWVPDHDALFARLFDALVPGGRLVSQCGGGPNLQRTRARANALMASARFAPFFEGWREVWNYAGIEETRDRVRRAGFTDVRVWLEPAPTTLPDAKAFEAFGRPVVLRTYLERLEPAHGDAFVQALVDQAAKDEPPFTYDYWRLNVDARRPA